METVIQKIAIEQMKRDHNLRGLGIFYHAGIAHLYFHSSLDDANTFHMATSDDGTSFQIDPTMLMIETGTNTTEDITAITNFSISSYSEHFLLLYTLTQPDGTKVVRKAWSKDLKHWSLEGPLIQIDTMGMIIPDYTYQKQSVLLGGDTTIDAYLSRDLITWEKLPRPVIAPRPGQFDEEGGQLAGTFATDKGLLVLYHTKTRGFYSVGVALLDPQDPTQTKWRCSEPIWSISTDWQALGAYPLGVILVENTILSYWHVPSKGLYEVAYAVYKVCDGMSTKDISLSLDRADANPLIAPNAQNTWESFNTFNPAAIYDEGKVHILYRAQGHDYVSVVGYASSSDGVTIDERLPEPIFVPDEHAKLAGQHTIPNDDPYASGGGYGGCEDPRITRIGDRYYLTYVSYDGVSEPRVALTSIKAQDFLNKRWLWEKPVIISKPGVIDKSAVIFPEKINGKYVIMHRVFPDILIDFVDSLEFDGSTFLEGNYKISVRPDMWDSRKIGAGAPPIKTKEGWLLIYYATCDQEGAGRYLMGAMLLDLDDPTKVLYRSKSPILEPESTYEWEGFKGGIVYPCGAVVIEDTLYVYYGGADSYVCVATANLEKFLQELKFSDVAKLSKPRIEPLFDMKRAMRSTQNPILSPDAAHAWEAEGTLNGSILIEKEQIHFLYRADSSPQDYHGHHLRLSSIGISETTDGIHFTNRRQLVTPSESWDEFGCEDPRVTKIENDYFVFYTALGGYPFGPDTIKVGLALFSDLNKQPEKHLITPFNAKAFALFPEKINGKYVALVTVNTDRPPVPDEVALAIFDSKEDIWSESYWKQWYEELDQHILPLRRMTSDQIEVGAVPIKTPQGWLCIYSHMQHYDRPDQRLLGIEAVMLDLTDPQKIIAWTDEPLVTPVESYETKGVAPNVVFPTSAFIDKCTLYLYYGAADMYCCLATFDLVDLYAQMRTNAVLPIKVHKYEKNPILEPISEHIWESHAVFNPAAVAAKGEIHLLYRALSEDNTSTLGHADTIDGVTITKRSEIPVYVPRAPFESKHIANGNSGCEDPRITIIDDTIYMCYTAYNGTDPARVAMSSIPLAQFVNREYAWSEPILLTPPGIDDKDGALFPEKCNGRYCLIHRMQNAIVLSFIEDFAQIDDTHWIHNHAYIPPRGEGWDSEKIGISAPPIKTEHGWLLLYHGVSRLSHVYRVGAMLLDLQDPSIVLSRTPWPILEPTQPYEQSGIVNNVVFPCGMVEKDGTFFIYYGAADTRVCVATIGREELLTYLLEAKAKTYLLSDEKVVHNEP